MEAVKFGNLGLKSIQDCQMWIRKNFSCHQYGLMLGRICGNVDTTNKANQFKTWESQIKLKISTGVEAAALQAVSSKRPRLFHVGKSAMVSKRNKSKLSQLANYAAWKSGGEGVHNYVVRQMNLLFATLSDEISYALGDNHNFVKANTLALRSLNDTVTFITQLMNYIDIIYDTSARQYRGVMIFG